MVTVELNAVLPVRLILRCLTVAAALTMLSLGSTAPAAAWWGDGCAAGFIRCDGACMPTVNHCCGTGGGESCRDSVLDQ